MKKIVALVMSIILALSSTVSVCADGTNSVNEYGDAYLVFGADLSIEQKQTVMELLEVTEDELPDYTQLEVTNKEEHKYLDAYLESSVIGKHAYSSIKLIPKEEGSGIQISTYNINYCTVSMYKNALLTAGMKDAEVMVAGPFEISGTAALIGAVKAYADSNNVDIDEEALETATNELVLTGELGDELGDAEKTAKLMAYVKQKVAAGDLDDPEEIRAVVEEGAKTIGLDLNDAQKDKIVKLMQKIGKLDLDPEVLEQQAKDLYDKLKDLGLDLEKVDAKGFFDFIKNFFNQIIDFISSLFD